jgi:2-dehydro-3-deoxy-D-arabinonate dehydratase
MKLIRYHDPARGPRVAVLNGDDVHDIAQEYPSIADWLKASVGRVDAAIDDLARLVRQTPPALHVHQIDQPPAPDRLHWLAPVDHQEVWAAGVTYERSRAARQEEAQDGGDIYARVYEAERPELFFKANGWRVVGHLDAVGIRADSAWNVPEPELGLLCNPALEGVGLVVGNDVSSRDIEGANPLYLPQAKVYDRACALGPGIALTPVRDFPPLTIQLTIERDGAALFTGETHTGKLRRQLSELTGYLGRALRFPDGVVLLTGTGIVPDSAFSLQPGDTVRIDIPSVGTLINSVIQV